MGTKFTMINLTGGLQTPVRIWKTVKRGGIRADAFCKNLKKGGFKLDESVREFLMPPLMLSSTFPYMRRNPLVFTVATEETEIDLANFSVGEMGFRDGARYDEICARGLVWGFRLCSVETVLQLRLQYLDQPKGEWLNAAMDSVADLFGFRIIFAIHHDHDGLWIGENSGYPGTFFHPESRFIFEIPRIIPPPAA